MRISFIETSEDGLSSMEYVFWLKHNERTFLLESYYERERKTKRHHFKATGIWSRLDKRFDNIKKPEISEQLKIAVLDSFLDSIKFDWE